MFLLNVLQRFWVCFRCMVKAIKLVNKNQTLARWEVFPKEKLS